MTPHWLPQPSERQQACCEAGCRVDRRSRSGWALCFADLLRGLARAPTLDILNMNFVDLAVEVLTWTR